MFKGTSAAGHKGWTRVYCVICNAELDLFKAVDEKNVYYCPNCIKNKAEAYFCEAHARNLHYRCPYCRGELKPYYV